MQVNVLEGGCFCGALRYRISGRPTNTMVCHCQSCRRVAGAPVVAWLTFAKPDFKFTRGTPSQFRSSDPVQRTFCSACGTPLTYQHSDNPATVDITTCSLDDANAFAPTHHSWLEHDLQWLRFGDGLPTFQRSRSDT